MSNESTAHKERLVSQFTELMTAKYDKGQQEHGGKLWEKKGLIDMAIDEAIDQVVYLLTLKEQLEAAGVELGVSVDEA